MVPAYTGTSGMYTRRRFRLHTRFFHVFSPCHNTHKHTPNTHKHTPRPPTTQHHTETERERETERDRERQRETERDRERQRDREKEDKRREERREKTRRENEQDKRGVMAMGLFRVFFAVFLRLFSASSSELRPCHFILRCCGYTHSLICH